jgi:hypothetical protein
VATPEFVVDDARRIDLRGSTDHPGLLVTLAPDRDEWTASCRAGIPRRCGRSRG